MPADLHAAKRAASDQWLGRVPGIEAVGSGALPDGSPALIVSWSGPVGPPDLPAVFQGLPVVLQLLPGPIRPLG